jgi:hypothetical protein
MRGTASDGSPITSLSTGGEVPARSALKPDRLVNRIDQLAGSTVTHRACAHAG